MSSIEHRQTPGLSVGDVVLHSSGMRVRLDKLEIHEHYEGTRHIGPVPHFCGTVLNAEEATANGVPAGFLYDHKTGRKDVWCIQGNELATWSVEA